MKNVPTFNTLNRRHEAMNPSTQPLPHYPRLAALPLPHIESFNAIFNHGIGRPGLLEYAVDDMGKYVIFDKTGQVGSANKLECKS